MNRASPLPPHVAEAVDASLARRAASMSGNAVAAALLASVKIAADSERGRGSNPGRSRSGFRGSRGSRAWRLRAGDATDAHRALFAATATRAATEMRFQELCRAAAATATWAERRGAPAREIADAVVAVNKGMTRALPRLTFTSESSASASSASSSSSSSSSSSNSNTNSDANVDDAVFATRGAFSRSLKMYCKLIRTGNGRVRTGLQRAVFDAVTRALPETDGFEWGETDLLGLLASTQDFASLAVRRGGGEKERAARDAKRSDASDDDDDDDADDASDDAAADASETSASSSSDTSRVPEALRDAIFLAVERALDRTSLGFFPAAVARHLSTFATRDPEKFRARSSTSEAMNRCVLRLVPELDARRASALAFELARAEAAGAIVLSDEVRAALRGTAARDVATMPSRTAVSALNSKMRAEHVARKASERERRARKRGVDGGAGGEDAGGSGWDASTSTSSDFGETNRDALFAAATRDVASFRGWDAALLARVAGYFRERPGSTFAKPPAPELVAALDRAAREFVAKYRDERHRNARDDDDSSSSDWSSSDDRSSDDWSSDDWSSDDWSSESSGSSPSSSSSSVPRRRPNASATLMVFEEYAKLRAVDGNPFAISSETMRMLLDAAVADLPRAPYAQLESFCAAIRRADDVDASRTRTFASRARDATEARMLAVVASNPPWKRPRAPGSALRLAIAWRDAFGGDAAASGSASMRDDLRLAMAEELAAKSRFMDPRTVVETLGVAADMGTNAPMTGATFAVLKSSLARAGRDDGPHSPETLRAALDALARLTRPENGALGRSDKALTRRLASRLCRDVAETWEANDRARESSRGSGSNPRAEFADAVADLRRLAACANWGRPDGWFWTESIPAAAAIARAMETESATIEDAVDALGVLGDLRASFQNVASESRGGARGERSGERGLALETRARRSGRRGFEPRPERDFDVASEAQPPVVAFPPEIARVAAALIRRVESAARDGAMDVGAADGRDVARAVAAAAAFARDDPARETLPRIQGLLVAAETHVRATNQRGDDDKDDDRDGSYSDMTWGGRDGSRSRRATPRGMSKFDALGVTLRALVELADADADVSDASDASDADASAGNASSRVPVGLLDALDARVAEDVALSVSSKTPSNALFTLAANWESTCRLALRCGATMPSGAAAGEAALRLARENPDDIKSHVAAQIVRCVAHAETIRERERERARESSNVPASGRSERSERDAGLAAALVERRAASWDPRRTASTAPAVAALARRFPDSNEVVDAARAFLLAFAATTKKKNVSRDGDGDGDGDGVGVAANASGESRDFRAANRLNARELAVVARACAELAELAVAASARGAWKGDAAEETAAAAEAARVAAIAPGAGAAAGASREVRAEVAAAVERMEAAAARCALESADGGGNKFESMFVAGG